MLRTIGGPNEEETPSMLHLPTSADRPTEIRDAGRRADRAMDLLQYGLALLAVAAAVVLGSVR